MNYLAWIRSHVGHTKIILSFASVVLQDELGRVLLQRRTDFNCWGLPGGVQELGEPIQDTAHRELYEETGMKSDNLRLVGLYSEPQWDTRYPNGDEVQQHSVCFAGHVHGGALRADGVETSAADFFFPDDIPWSEIPGYYAAMLRDALAGGLPAFQAPYALPERRSFVDVVRPHIGHAPLIAPGAAAVVVDDEGRVLMQQRADDGSWDFPGGFCDLGENAPYTAVRETREETGLEIELERLLGLFSQRPIWTYENGDQVQMVVSLYRAHVTGGELKSDGKETLDLAWLTPQEVFLSRADPLFLPLKRAVVAHLDDGHFIL